MATDATHTDVKDAAGAVKTLNDRQIGRVAQAQGAATSLCTEDKAALDQLHTDLVAVEDFVDSLEALTTATNAALATANAALAALVTASASTADSNVEAHTPCDVISLVPLLDASGAYAVGDVLFATTAVTVTRANDLRAILQSLTVIDKAKAKPGFTIFFYQSAVSSAAANAANNLSDTDAATCMGFVRIATTDWIDLANNSFACLKGIGLLLESLAGAQTVDIVGVVDAGTPTYAVGDLVLKFGVLQQ